MTAFMRGRQGNLLLYLDRAFNEKVNTKKSQCPISNCATAPAAASDHYQRFVDNIFWNWNFDQFPFAADGTKAALSKVFAPRSRIEARREARPSRP
jgi:hypothetical protein